MSWTGCREVCWRAGLCLPGEALWEFAARAGSDTPWWTGSDMALLSEVANVADLSYRDDGNAGTVVAPWDDGVVFTSPVGRLHPNPFGLHDVHGNVWEWCEDIFDFYDPGPNSQAALEDETRILRGGAFDGAPVFARSSVRFDDTPDNVDYNLGVRPARVIEP